MHGSGTRKRVLNGTRQDPRVAGALHHGGKMSPEVKAAFEKLNPEYAALVGHYRSLPLEELQNLAPLLADLRAMRDVLARRLPDATAGMFGEGPPALLAVLTELSKTLERASRIQERAEKSALRVEVKIVALWIRAVVGLIHEYVPAPRLPAAIGRLQALEQEVRAHLAQEVS